MTGAVASLRYLSPWFAFTGRAFLTSDARELTAEARDLGDDRLESSLLGDPVELRKEYVRLFLDPGGAPCPLWQSAQGPEPRLMGSSHFSALSWFRTEDIEPQPASLPADHIGLLLAFFANLTQAGVHISLLDYYYREHLAWIPSFCDEVAAQAQHPFYRQLARITSLLVEQVRAELDH